MLTRSQEGLFLSSITLTILKGLETTHFWNNELRKIALECTYLLPKKIIL